MKIAEPIVTQRLKLRQYVKEDIDALYALRSREDVTRYLYWGPQSREEVRKVVERRIPAVALEREGDSIVLAVETRAGGVFIGDINLTWVSHEHGFAEMGFIIDPNHRGQGYAGEAARAILAVGFERAGLHRIVGRCDARNTASARVMEKLGMRREAHFIQNEFIKGEWTDELVYAMLADEWPRA